MLEICKRLINEYGEQFELRKVQEELKELDLELDQYLNHGKENRNEIINEMADVQIQLTNLKLVFCISEKELEDAINEKIEKIKKCYLD